MELREADELLPTKKLRSSLPFSCFEESPSTLFQADSSLHIQLLEATLNCISEGLLIFQGEILHFFNKAFITTFLQLSDYQKQYQNGLKLELFIRNYPLFNSTLKQTLTSERECFADFQFGNFTSHEDFMARVTFYPFQSCPGSCCCLFRRINDNRQSQQKLTQSSKTDQIPNDLKLEMFEVFTECFPLTWMYFEYNTVENRISPLFSTSTTSQLSHFIGESREYPYISSEPLPLLDSLLLDVQSLYQEQDLANKQYHYYKKNFQFPDGRCVNLNSVIKCIDSTSNSSHPRFLQIIKDLTIEENSTSRENKRVSNQMDSDFLFILQSFFDHSPIGLAALELIDSCKRIRIHISNPAFDNLSSGKLRALLSNSTDDENDRKMIDDWICKFLECTRGQVSISFERELFGYLLDCKATHLKENLFSFFVQDITVAKQAENKHSKEEEKGKVFENKEVYLSEEILKQKSIFLASVSHEIRTPLTGIMGSLELLMENETLSSEQREILRIGYLCGEQLLSLINDILDLSKLEQNKLELEYRPFYLMDPIECSLEMLSLQAEKKGLILSSDITEPDILFRRTKFLGDACRLRQILMNLLGNAVKFSEKGEIVVQISMVSTENDEKLSRDHETNGNGEIIQTVLFAISDQGIGIPFNVQKILFQSFTQADRSISRRYGGSGLGLCICKKLVHLMGGDIWMESMEGKGSTFYFTIKAAVISSPLENKPYIQIEPVYSIPQNASEETPFPWRGKQVVLFNLPPQSAIALSRKLQFLGLSVIIEKKQGHLQILKETNSICKYVQSLAEIIKKDCSLLFVDGDQLPTETMEWLISEQKHSEKPMVIVAYQRSKLWSSKIQFLKKPILFHSIIGVLSNVFGEHLFSPTSNNLGTLDTTIRNKIFVEKNKIQNILIAEDSYLNQKIISKILESIGKFNTKIVSNGKQVCDAVKHEDFDIILMDLNMPEIGGIEATQIIRHQLPNWRPQPAIIALTADAFKETEFQCLHSGMDYVVTKPIDRKRLQEAICLSTEKLKEGRNTN